MAETWSCGRFKLSVFCPTKWWEAGEGVKIPISEALLCTQKLNSHRLLPVNLMNEACYQMKLSCYRHGAPPRAQIRWVFRLYSKGCRDSQAKFGVNSKILSHLTLHLLGFWPLFLCDNQKQTVFIVFCAESLFFWVIVFNVFTHGRETCCFFCFQAPPSLFSATRILIATMRRMRAMRVTRNECVNNLSGRCRSTQLVKIYFKTH